MWKILCLGSILSGFFWQSAECQNAATKPLRFDFKVNKRRVDVERKQTVDKNLAEEKWLYEVEVVNSTFAPQSNLTIDYKVFKRDDKYGADKNTAKLPLKGTAGHESIAAMANATSHKFKTPEIQIEKDELKAGWTYTDNSKSKVKDSLYGIWIKVMKDGAMVAEYTNPPALKTKVDW